MPWTLDSDEHHLWGELRECQRLTPDAGVGWNVGEADNNEPIE